MKQKDVKFKMVLMDGQEVVKVPHGFPPERYMYYLLGLYYTGVHDNESILTLAVMYRHTHIKSLQWLIA